MDEPRGQPGLAQEPIPEALLLGEMLREHFERDRPVELAVAREIDARHPATAERPLDE